MAGRTQDAHLIIAVLLRKQISHIQIQVGKVDWVDCKQRVEVLYCGVHVLQMCCADACSHLQQAPLV